MNKLIDKDLQEIIDLVAEGVQVSIKQFADGWQITDLFPFIPVLSKIPEAIKDAQNALNYLGDMNEEKETEIVDGVIAKLNDASDDVKEGARRILRALAEIYMTAKFFSKLKKPATDTGKP
jgi:hypothetical protein